MSHELTLLAINCVLLLVAYLLIYPALGIRSAWRLVMIDIVITGFALGLAWVLYGGMGLRFSLILFETNFVVFSFVTMLIIEWPMFRAYCRQHDIRMSDLDLGGRDRSND